MTASPTNALAAKAVLASVTIRRWTGRRLDRKITDEVNKANNAEDDAGRYNKLLISQKAFEGIGSVVRAARSRHYTMTLPWADEGARILPADLYSSFSKDFQKFREDFNKEADAFAKVYPNYLGAARKRLGKMYNGDEYPPPNAVRKMFDFGVYILPCPTSGDFRVKLAKEQVDDIRSDLEDRMKQALVDAMKDPVQRVTEVVGKMSERLKNYKPGDRDKGVKPTGMFRDSLVDNIKELVALLPAFNLTGDARLTKLTEAVAKQLCSTDAQTLRDDEKVRKAVAKSADAILKQAESLLA